MATIEKERARRALLETRVVVGSRTFRPSSGIGYRIDLHGSGDEHDYSITLTCDEMLRVVASWLEAESAFSGIARSAGYTFYRCRASASSSASGSTPPMSAPLVERLRRYEHPNASGAPAHLVCEARTQIECDRRTIEAQAAEIERLNERLENNHVFNLAGDRIDVPPGSIPDGIDAREETIKLLDEQVDRLRSELAAKEAAVQILLGIPLVCVTDAEIAHAKEQRAAAIRASGKEG